MAQEDDSLEERSVSLQDGPIPRPEGDEAIRHGGKSEEASRGALTKPDRQVNPTSTPSSHDGGRDADLSSSEHFDLVRNTTRFEIDLPALSAHLNTDRQRGEKRKISEAEKALRDALEDISRLATTAKNVAIRELERRDAAALDAYMGEHGTMPTGAALKDIFATPKEAYSYPLMTRACPRLSSNVTATLQRAIDGKWLKERYDVLIRQNRSRPHFKVGQPFPIPKSALRIKKDGDGLLVTMSFYSTKHSDDIHKRRFTVPMRPRDDHQRRELEKIASGEWRHGQAVIEKDRLRYKWYIKLAYSRRVPKKTGTVVAAINKGMRTMLACVTSADGSPWTYEAQDIEATLKQFQARRKQYQYASKAAGRAGHGRRRILRPVEPLLGKAERYRDWRCKVIARRLVEWLVKRDVSVLYIDDFAGIRDGVPEKLEGGKWIWDRIQEWPYYQLQTRIVSCAEEAGITCVIVESPFISQTCPKCGHTDPSHRDLGRWRFRCKKCKYNQHLDVAAAQNVMARGQALAPDEAKKRQHVPGKRKEKTKRTPWPGGTSGA